MSAHDSRAVLEARKMAAAGWGPFQIARLLTDCGVKVTGTTVKTWLDDDYRRKRQALTAAAKARQRKARAVRLGNPRFRPETLVARVRRLDELGVSYRAIAKVMRLDFGDDWTEGKVRTILDGGTPYDLRRTDRVA